MISEYAYASTIRTGSRSSIVGSTNESASIAIAIGISSMLATESPPHVRVQLLLAPRLKIGIGAADCDSNDENGDDDLGKRGGDSCRVADAVDVGAAAAEEVVPRAGTASTETVKASPLQPHAKFPLLIGSTEAAAAKVDEGAGKTPDAEADADENETVRGIGLALFEARAAAHDDDHEADEAVSEVEGLSADEVEDEKPAGCVAG